MAGSVPFVEWWERGGEPVQVFAALWADVEYRLGMAVERGGLPLTDLAGCPVVRRWRRVGDVHWVAIRELPDGGFAVEASWLRFCGADRYSGDTPGEALDAAMDRAGALRDSVPGGRWEVTADGRTPVSAGAVVRSEGEADGVARDAPRLVSQRAPVADAGEHASRAPAVR